MIAHVDHSPCRPVSTQLMLHLSFLCHQVFADNLFLLFDTDHNGSVSFQELVGGLSKLSK